MVGNESNPVYLWSRWICNPVALKNAFHNVVLLFMFADFCVAESLTPAEALDRDLATSGDRQSGYSDATFTVQIDASLPKLRKRGSPSGFKVVPTRARSDIFSFDSRETA